MNMINNGGPVFPVPDSHGWWGMPLRDYFAAKAMQSLLVADGTSHFEMRASEAYEMADAMLKARELKP